MTWDREVARKAVEDWKKQGISRRTAGALVYRAGVLNKSDLIRALEPEMIIMVKGIGKRGAGEVLLWAARKRLLRWRNIAVAKRLERRSL